MWTSVTHLVGVNEQCFVSTCSPAALPVYVLEGVIVNA